MHPHCRLPPFAKKVKDGAPIDKAVSTALHTTPGQKLALNVFFAGLKVNIRYCRLAARDMFDMLIHRHIFAFDRLGFRLSILIVVSLSIGPVVGPFMRD